MPQTGQIIPRYKHPHEETYINDNTIRTDYANDNTGNVFLHVFASRSGRDRKLLFFKNISDFINEFDLPNYRLYGQPMLNAYACLQTGLAQSQSMRVTADDATFANMVLVARYKIEDAKLKIKFECVSKRDLREADDLDAYLTTLEVTEPDADGYEALPIMKFISRGRGVYGNDYRIRINHDKNSDKYNGYKNYLIELLSTSDGFSKLETYNVSFYIDAIDPATKFTLFVNDIVDDEEGKGSSRFTCELLYDNLEKIYEKYKEVCLNNGYIPPTIEYVERLPGTELPKTDTTYRLTADDGDAPAGSMWVFDDSGVFVDTGKTGVDVSKLPIIKPAELTNDVLYWAATDGVYAYNPNGDNATMFVKTEKKLLTKESVSTLSSGIVLNTLYATAADNSDLTRVVDPLDAANLEGKVILNTAKTKVFEIINGKLVEDEVKLASGKEQNDLGEKDCYYYNVIVHSSHDENARNGILRRYKAADKSNEMVNPATIVMIQDLAGAVYQNDTTAFKAKEDGSAITSHEISIISDGVFPTLTETDAYYKFTAVVNDNTSIYHVTEENNAGYYVLTSNKYRKIKVYESETTPPVNVGFADPFVVYTLTADDGEKQNGISYVVAENDWAVFGSVTKVDVLPPTKVYEEGVVYELELPEGDKPARSQWIFYPEFNDYIPFVDDGPAPLETPILTMETFDIFGYNRLTKDDDELFEFDGGKEAIQILSIEGAPLSGGSDGALGADKTTSEREAALEKAYLKAFNGEFDKTILSKRRAPLVMMLDANYSFNVKSAMVALTLNRGDCTCHLDTGLIQNIADIDTYAISMNAFADRLIVKDCGMWKVIDPITGKIIPVTVTYWLSQKFPNHFYSFGNHTPMAGENYAVVTGYEKNSIRPVIDADDAELKEKIYDEYHMNYIEALDETTYVRGTQNTSQDIISDLSEENNMLVLLEIKRKLERLAASNRYNWSDPDSVRMYKEAAENIFSSYIGTKCQSLDLDISYNDWENLNYIVHVYCSVVFRMFQKISIIEIDVNPRV